MNILYMSVHEILEYDELRLFTELGYRCFSLGAYTQPGGEEHRKRPALDLPYDPHFIELALQYPKKLIKEQLDGMDIVIVMHEPTLLDDNWPVFRDFIERGGRVIWRSIGQSVPSVEVRINNYRERGLEIVRYSPAEETIDHYAGADAMIRFYKDPDEYQGWTGSRRQVINFTQSLKQRARFTGYDIINRVTDGLPAKVYGPGNDDLGLLAGGLLTHEDQLDTLREARCYLYTGTYPASYTLSFMEAMMVGIPMICVGAANGNSKEMFPNQDTYEVPALIQDGLNGYVTDDLQKLRQHIRDMLDNEHMAKTISTFGRARAIELFGKSKIKHEWREFLEKGRA